jgi:hypothetical protein
VSTAVALRSDRIRSAAWRSYVALQSVRRRCAASPAGDHEPVLTEQQVIDAASMTEGVYSFQFSKQVTVAKDSDVQHACGSQDRRTRR